MKSQAPELLRNVLTNLAYEDDSENVEEENFSGDTCFPVCACYNPKTSVQNQLLYEPISKKYFYQGECSEDRICALIMKQKNEYRLKNGNLFERKGISYTADLKKFVK